MRWLAVILAAACCAGLQRTAFAQTSGQRETSPEGTPAARPELALGRSADYDYDPPEPGSYKLPVIEQAADGEVLGTDGQRRRLLSTMDNRIAVLSFIYTRCRDPRACPMATAVLSQLHQLSEKDAGLTKNMRLITLSFDPSFDTPKVMDSFKEVWQTEMRGADWIFLTTKSPDELAPILREYRQVVGRKKNPSDVFGPYYHNLHVFLIDRERRIRNIYSSGMLDPRLVATDVRTLLLEEQATKPPATSR